MERNSLIAAPGLGLAAVAVPAPAFAKDAPVYAGTLSNTAVSGHDTDAHFIQGKPVKSSTEFRTTYNGVEWRLASAANLAGFRADPGRYAP
jgi:YHS domain-containing protein